MSIFKGWPSLTEIFFGKKETKVMSKKAPTLTETPKPKATPRTMAAPKPRGTNKDLNLQQSLKKARNKVTTKAEKKPTKKELSKLTKIQLEELGRQKGIELDRRLSKDKLVAQVHKKL